MSDIIKSILQDLYRLDPALREREEEVVKIIEKLVATRPAVRVDEQFLRSLKKELLSRFNQVPQKESYQINIVTFMSRFKLIAGGAVVAALVIAPLTYFLTKEGGVQNMVSDRLAESGSLFDQGSGDKGVQLGERAFGSLVATAEPSGRDAAAPALPSADADSFAARPPSQSYSEARPQSSGGMPARESAPVPMGMGGDGQSGKAMPSSLIFPAPDMVNYRFAYKGDEIKLDEEKVEVLKREKGFSGAGNVSQMWGRIGDGLIDFGKFSSAKLQNFSFVEDRDFGYFVNVDLQEGIIYVSQNWARWPQVNCQDQACWEARRVRESDIPADDALIKLAGDFMKEKGISLKGYGEPEVDRTWRVMYERMAAAERASYYFPEQVTVKYPLLVDGEKVYEGPGQTAGLYVSIDVKERKVSGVSNMMNQRYARSNYEAVTDASQIVKIAEEGGMYSYAELRGTPNQSLRHGTGQASRLGLPQTDAEGESGLNAVTLNLDTPERGFMKHWQYQNNTSNELLVPALIFPVENPPSEGWAPTQVIVPLVKEILDSRTAGGPDGPVKILPVPEPMPLEQK